MIAKDLDTAYINFDPSQPLPSVSEYYVKRKYNPLEQIKRDLLRPNVHQPKFLFSGHRGSGKSTELNRLIAYPEIQERYFTVQYSVRDVLDTAGLDYTDLLVSIGAQIFIEADKTNLKMRDKLLDRLSGWKSSIDVEKEKSLTAGGELGANAGLASFFSQLLLKLKLEYVTRQKIRETIAGRISELMDIIDLITMEVELLTEKKVLVVIDDLDKPDLKIASKIFYEMHPWLVQPKCGIIYTVPIALHYSSDFGQVKSAFTENYVLPNITINKYEDRKPNEEGRAIMREFVQKRMSLDLIKGDALEYATAMSGGVFREMARLVRKSADNAVARDDDVIEISDVEDAINEIRNEFRRMLTTEDYKTLKEIYERRELIGSNICSPLLHNLSIIEYRNKHNWCDVHPAIIPLLKD